MACCAPFTSYVSQAIFSISRIENVRRFFGFVFGFLFFKNNIKRKIIRKYASFKVPD